MSATKAFDLVTEAYIEATGQTKDQAKGDVAEALAKSWALGAFGDGVASRVGHSAPAVHPGQQQIEVADKPKRKPKGKPKGKGKGGSK